MCWFVPLVLLTNLSNRQQSLVEYCRDYKQLHLGVYFVSEAYLSCSIIQGCNQCLALRQWYRTGEVKVIFELILHEKYGQTSAFNEL